MTDVPKTAIDLEQLIAAHKNEWPPELALKATFAMNSLKVMDRPDNQYPSLVRLNRADVEAFDAAYAEWRGQ